jgi:hypothetical protein
MRMVPVPPIPALLSFGPGFFSGQAGLILLAGAPGPQRPITVVVRRYKAKPVPHKTNIRASQGDKPKIQNARAFPQTN